MAERRVTSAEIVRNFGPLSDEALKTPVTITRNGRDRLVLLAVEEYERLKRRDRQVYAVEDLPGELVEALEQTRMDPRHDHLNELYESTSKDAKGVSVPAPEPGLVIRYSYLWQREYAAGREEGAKDRPCAIVMVVQEPAGHESVVVVPVTHAAPEDPSSAIEIPQDIKRGLGLDTDRSWIVATETNVFHWPGPDLRPVEIRSRTNFAYGLLPPRFFDQVRRRMIELLRARRVKNVPRTE